MQHNQPHNCNNEEHSEVNSEHISDQAVEQNEEITENLDRETDVASDDKAVSGELSLDEQLAAAQEKIAQMEVYVSLADEREKDIQLRARAEIENIRKRAANDVEKAHKFALERFAKDLLSVADNLARALATLQQADETLCEGVLLTSKELTKVLEQHGVKAFGVVGEAFDPSKHQAISQMPQEGIESNHISSVMQQGYTLNERVIRDAMVAVAP